MYQATGPALLAEEERCSAEAQDAQHAEQLPTYLRLAAG